MKRAAQQGPIMCWSVGPVGINSVDVEREFWGWGGGTLSEHTSEEKGNKSIEMRKQYYLESWQAFNEDYIMTRRAVTAINYV